MKKLWLLLLLVIPYQAIHAQEVHHPPTVEQCRADQRLWFSKLEQEPAGAGIANVSYTELHGWGREMNDCWSVDPEFQIGYTNVLLELTVSKVMRLQGFLSSHNMYDQFLAEDAQGKR